MIVITKRSAAVPVSSDSATETSATFFFSNIPASLQAVKLRNNKGLYTDAFDERQRATKAGPV